MFFREKDKKVFVIGLDSTPAKLLFEDFKEELPNLGKMIDEGTYANFRSIHPPVTIPAWMSMCSGKTAGEMGVYGFRVRINNSYTKFDISTSFKFKNVEKIWDKLAKHGKKSILVGIPPTYPPYPIEGCMVSGFICPNAEKKYTYPESLKKEIERICGEYIFDVVFRTEERDKLIQNLWEMTEKRFTVIEYLIKNKEWDFFMFVEIGVDRIQHAFWKYYDPSHPLYQPNHKYKNVILDYYKFIDEKIGRILSLFDKNTVVYVVSDHGAKAMKGSFCLNEWLIKEGYLVLNKYPQNVVPLEEVEVNWFKTRAWGWGGYYGRIFINKKGRERQGIVDEEDYEKLRDELIIKLEREKDKFGRTWNTKVYRPEELYSALKGDYPDLMAYFDDLAYRSAGTVGHKKLFLDENDTGPDDAMHDWEGVFIKYDPREKGKGREETISILDFKKNIMETMNIK